MPCPHKGRGCPQMTNGSELTSFSIYNFRGQNSPTTLGNPARPWGIFSPIVCPLQVLLGPVLPRREHEAVRSPGGPGARPSLQDGRTGWDPGWGCFHPRHPSLVLPGSGVYGILELGAG